MSAGAADERALRRLGALLGPGRPKGATPITSSEDPDLPAVLAVADRHGLVPAAWSRLMELGIVDEVPTALRAFVARRRPEHGSLLLAAEAAHAENAVRMADLLDQATTALAALTDAGLRAAPLKGADAVLTGRYPDPAARTMTDVDLLVDAADAGRAAAVLAGLGYREAPDAPPNDHQLPALVAPGRAGSIELHTELAVRRWAHVLPAVDALDGADPAPDGTGLRLWRTDSLTHLIVHAQLHDEAHLLGRLALRSLHETALALAGEEDVDWQEVADRFDAVWKPAALAGHLQQARDLFGSGIPAPVGISRVTLARASAVVALDSRPALAHRVTQVAYLPRALSSERMAELHGATGPVSRLTARVGHVARGLTGRSPASS